MKKVNFSVQNEGPKAADVKVRAAKSLIIGVICDPTNHRVKGIKRGTGSVTARPTVHGCRLSPMGNGYYRLQGDTDKVIEDLGILEADGLPEELND